MQPAMPVFPPAAEAQFRASRAAALAEVNASNFWLVALLVIVFSGWDWYVDPVHWTTALAIRCAGVAVILATGMVQRATRTEAWAPLLAKVRFSASVVAVAGAIAVLDQGYILGLAGLVSVFLAAPYIAIDRRDYLVLNAPALAAVGAIMYAARLDTFVMVNSWIFLALAIATGFLLARVFEVSNRRAFALEQDLQREARTDALTGIANRRALEEFGFAELSRGQRTGNPTALILFDLDYFKRFNDAHGHDTGDRIIRAVVERLKPIVRAADCMGRWGGEEFLVVLPGTAREQAVQLAERMRAALDGAVLLASPEVRATISLGVSAGQPQPGTGEAARWQALLKAADDAMYRAKAAGRNRVEADRASS